MTTKEKIMIKLGLKASDFQPRNAENEIDEALCELAEMLAAQDDAICELAEIIGGLENG